MFFLSWTISLVLPGTHGHLRSSSADFNLTTSATSHGPLSTTNFTTNLVPSTKMTEWNVSMSTKDMKSTNSMKECPQYGKFRKLTKVDWNNVGKVREAAAYGKEINPIKYFEYQDLVENFVRTDKARTPRVLEVGANDGLLRDALFPVVFAHEWAGTLIEPVPKMFAELKRNYMLKRGEIWKGLELVEKAVAESEGNFSLRVPLNMNGCDLNGVGHAPGTKHVHEEQWDVQFVDINVTGAPLAKLLSYDQYDVVQIDVEGYDSKVMQQLAALPWAPLLLCVEECDTLCQEYFNSRGFKNFTVKNVGLCGYDPRIETSQ